MTTRYLVKLWKFDMRRYGEEEVYFKFDPAGGAQNDRSRSRIGIYGFVGSFLLRCIPGMGVERQPNTQKRSGKVGLEITRKTSKRRTK